MNTTETVVTPETSFKIQLTKFVLGTVAGFVAGKLVEKAFDKGLTTYQDRTASPEA